MVDAYRDFVEENHPGRVLHYFDSLEAQVDGIGQCKTCQRSHLRQVLGEPCDPMSDLRSGSSIQIMTSGTPCPPFSTQRSKRFVDGSVKDHHAFDLTMEKLIELYAIYEPEKALLEQVWGFTLPFQAGGGETPKQRPG